jgi:hypothetical protein
MRSIEKLQNLSWMFDKYFRPSMLELLSGTKAPECPYRKHGRGPGCLHVSAGVTQIKKLLRRDPQLL